MASAQPVPERGPVPAAITTLANGNIAVAFADLFFGNSDITCIFSILRCILSGSDYIEARVAQTFFPSLTALADGGYVVSYTLGTGGTNTYIVARTVSASGGRSARSSISTRPSTVRNDPQGFSHLEMLSNGNFVSSIQGTFKTERTNSDIRFGIFTAAGRPVLPKRAWVHRRR